MKVRKYQLWGTADRKEFCITDVKEIDGQIWVHYSNRETKQTYSCLEPAFTQRFSPIVNTQKENPCQH